MFPATNHQLKNCEESTMTLAHSMHLKPDSHSLCDRKCIRIPDFLLIVGVGRRNTNVPKSHGCKLHDLDASHGILHWNHSTPVPIFLSCLGAMMLLFTVVVTKLLAMMVGLHIHWLTHRSRRESHNQRLLRKVPSRGRLAQMELQWPMQTSTAKWCRSSANRADCCTTLMTFCMIQSTSTSDWLNCGPFFFFYVMIIFSRLFWSCWSMCQRS